MNINEFIGHVEKNGLAKTNKFTIFINKPFAAPDNGPFNDGKSRDFKFSCESIEFPGRGLLTSDNRIYGTSFKTPYGNDYQEITLTLLCDRELSEKRYFDNWIEFINPSSSFDFQYRDDYVTDLKIMQMQDDGATTYICSLLEAYPLSVGALSANWSDDGFHRVQIRMTYRYWTSEENQFTTAEDTLPRRSGRRGGRGT